MTFFFFFFLEEGGDYNVTSNKIKWLGLNCYMEAEGPEVTKGYYK